VPDNSKIHILGARSGCSTAAPVVPQVLVNWLRPGFFLGDDARINHNRSTRNHLRELQALGYKVILERVA